MDEQHDTASANGADIAVIEPPVPGGTPNHGDATAPATRRRRTAPRGKPFEPKVDATPDDLVASGNIPRRLKALALEQRDRVDPATDSRGRPRPQHSNDRWIELLIEHGIEDWAKGLPSYVDPFAVSHRHAGKR